MFKNISMLKKKNDILRILAVIVGVVAVGALIYIFGITALLNKGNADQALSAGEVQITSVRDLDNYFIFLPKERAQALLQESGDKFLFPQISLAVADDNALTIREQKITRQDKQYYFITISGLPTGTKLYTVGEFIRGSVASYDVNMLYAWAREGWAEEGNHNVMLTYISVPNVDTADNSVFNIALYEKMASSVEQGIHYATLLTDATLPEELVPGGANIAVAMAGDDGIFTKLSLQNILTYKGRIVMIERQP